MPISISAEPAAALVDVPTAVTIAGLAPGETTVVETLATDHAGVEFRSWQRFAADGAGRVDLGV